MRAARSRPVSFPRSAIARAILDPMRCKPSGPALSCAAAFFLTDIDDPSPERVRRHGPPERTRAPPLITVAIIEDNRLVREGMTDMLNELPDVRVVLAAASLDPEQLKVAQP